MEGHVQVKAEVSQRKGKLKQSVQGHHCILCYHLHFPKLDSFIWHEYKFVFIFKDRSGSRRSRPKRFQRGFSLKIKNIS